MTVDPERLQLLLNCTVCAAVPLAVALVIGFVVMRWFGAQRRASDMATLASQLGFQFVAHDATISRRLAGFTDFERGHSREGRNICWGNIVFGGVRAAVILGDYRYTVSPVAGKDSSTRTYEMSFISLVPVLAVREDLSVRRESVLDRIGTFVGLDDIDFESSEFSKRFHVKCSDRRFAYDLFDPRMIEFFLSAPPPDLEARGGIIVIDDAATRWTVAGFRDRLAWLDGFFARIPRHVRAERLPPAERAFDPILNPEAPSDRKVQP